MRSTLPSSSRKQLITLTSDKKQNPSDQKEYVLALVLGHFSTLAERHNWQNLNAFFNPGCIFERVHVIALGDDFEYSETQFGTVHVHPVRSMIRSTLFKPVNSLFILLAGMLKIMVVVRKYRIDLVAQIFSTPLKYGLPVVIVAKMLGIPSIITLCNDYPRLEGMTYGSLQKAFSRLVWPFIFKNCTKVRSKGGYIANFALGYGVPSNKVAVISNKMDLDKFMNRPSIEELERVAEELGIANLIRDSVVFLTVARLIPAKNFRRVMEAFALSAQRQSNLVYLIVGQGPLEKELNALAYKLGIADRVRMLGYFSHEKLRYIYRLAHVFLFVTLYEGQPRVVNEAIVSELPIICSNYGEVTEVVKHGVDGLLVNPRDVIEISDAIYQLAADSSLREKMSLHSGFNPSSLSLEQVGTKEAAFYLQTIREFHDRKGLTA